MNNITKSHSQYRQDLNVIDFYRELKGGFFVDIGAFDGISISNTYKLEKEYFWSGICIEPQKDAYDKLKSCRNSICINRAVSRISGQKLEFSEGKGGNRVLSGFTRFLDGWGKSRALKGTQSMVTSLTLTDILDNYSAPQFIHFLSLDTEGSELEILLGHDFERYQFGYICVEHNHVEPRRSEIRTLLEKNGYFYYQQNACDDDYFHRSIVSGTYYFNSDESRPITVSLDTENVVCASSDYWPDHKGTFDPAALTIEFDEIGRRRVYGTAIVRSESDIWHKKNNSVTATDVLIIPTDSLSHDDAEFVDIKKFAESAFRRRDFTRSIALYREYFQCSKPDLMSLLCAARACMLLENTHDALSYYDQAIKLAPSHGSALTRKSCFLLKHRLGALTPQPQKKGRDQISMRSLGNKGRFGNQIFQYSFLKIYAEKFNLEIGTEEWAGQYIFSLNDPRPSTLPGVVRESQVNMIDALRSTECKLANKDITGYFQFHTNKWSAHRALFQSTFAPKGRFFDLLSPTISQIHATTDALIVLHLRRGDFGSTRFPVSPLNWHLEWLQEIWPQYRNPVLYIATDDPNIIQSFSDFSAIGFPDLEIDFDLNGIEYIADWIMIQQGSVLGLSNSTFSMSAALANHRANVFYRPDFSANRLIEFDPWNAPILVPD